MATVPLYNNNQQSVQQQSLPDYRVQSVATPDTFGADVGKTLSAIGEDYNQAAIKQKDQEDTNAVLNATNSMTQDMINFTNGDNGIYSRQGINAKGSLTDTQQFFDDTDKKYTATLANPEQVLAFKQHMKPNVLNIMRDVGTYERNQGNVYSKQLYETNVNTNNQGVELNYTNPDTMNTFIVKNNQLIDARAKLEGWGPEVANAEKIARNTAGLNGAFVSAMKEQNYDAAGNILKTFQKSTAPVVYENMKSSLNKIQQQNQNFVAADNIVKQATNPDGTVDRAKAQALLDSQYGVDVTKTIPGITSGYDSQFDTFKNSMVSVESGGNYNAQGPTMSDGDYAIGKYQIMKSNWSNWAQSAGLSADAEPTPENQDKVYAYKIKQYYDEFGGDWGKVAVAWQAGPGRANLSDSELANISDGNMTTLEYKNAVAGSVGGTPDQTISAFDANKYRAIQQQVNAKITDATQIYNQKQLEYKKGLSQQLDGAGSLEEGLAIVNNSNLDFATKNQLIGALNTKYKRMADPNATKDERFYSSYERTGLYRDQSTLDKLEGKYANGDTLTDTEWKTYKDTKYKLDRYNNWATNGAYGQQQQEQDKSRYDAILADLWDSKTVQERVNKANTYKDELNQLGQKLDRDVNNDLTNIMNNGQG